MTNNILPMEIHTGGKNKKRIKKTVPEILRVNNSINDKIKIRGKKISDGSYSLYLDLRNSGKNEYQFLGIYIKDGKKDKEQINLALELRNKKQNELFQNFHDFRLRDDYLNINFIDYFEKIARKRIRPDKSWNNTLKHLRIFTKGKSITFRFINMKFCEDFRDYLISNLGSMNTAHVYFAKLKACLNRAVKEDIILKNPAQFLHISKQETQREFLILEELKQLKNASCPDEQTKRAFLFSCFTGLRISDIVKLTFDEVQNGYLLFRQKKTRDAERLKLSHNALEIIEMQKNEGRKEGIVFNLVTAKHALKHLKKWKTNAHINKNVTWHVGRHTFATLAITYGNDIYTVSKLLGHREVRTTQIYAKLIDQKKDEAIDKLPVI